MALQPLPIVAALMPMLPGIGAVTTSLGSDATFIFNAAADKLAFLFQAPSAIPPDQIKFRCSSFTTLGTLDVTLETVDPTTGFPTGTLVTNSVLVPVAVASTGTKTASGLAGTAVLTPGEIYAVVLTATAAFVGNFQILRTTGGNGGPGFPVGLTKDSAGAWTKISTTNCGFAIGFFTSAGVAIPMPSFAGAYTATFQAFSDATNPDERGSRFTLPFPTTCYGIAIVVNCSSTPADAMSFTASLYSDHTSGTPTQLATLAIDGDYLGLNSLRYLMFAAPVDLAANTVYALAAKADGATGISLMRHAYASADELGCYISDDFYATTRNNGAGAFTDTDTEVYAIYPLLGKFDDGTGGGGSGGQLLANMRGNFQ